MIKLNKAIRQAVAEALRAYQSKLGKKANKARNAALSAKERKQIATKAAKTRWAGRRRHAL
jgi:hypothetical protein